MQICEANVPDFQRCSGPTAPADFEKSGHFLTQTQYVPNYKHIPNDAPESRSYLRDSGPRCANAYACE